MRIFLTFLTGTLIAGILDTENVSIWKQIVILVLGVALYLLGYQEGTQYVL